MMVQSCWSLHITFFMILLGLGLASHLVLADPDAEPSEGVVVVSINNKMFEISFKSLLLASVVGDHVWSEAQISES